MAQNFRRHTANAVGTSAVEIFQSNGFDCVVGISLSNVLGTAINATAYINDGSSDISIITTAPIPTGSSEIVRTAVEDLTASPSVFSILM